VRPILLWLNPRISEETIEKIHFLVRKTAHFAEYALLGFLTWRVVAAASALAPLHSAQHFRLALLFAALYAASDETHQIFVPGREASVRDVLLDTCGAGFGLVMVWAAHRVRKLTK